MTLKRLPILLLLSAMLVGGCSGKDNVYSGIEQQDLTGIKTAKELDYIYAYKGHTGNWASTYYVYQKKDSDSHVSKVFLKYIGKEPGPSGEMKYAYTTEGGGGGSGTLFDAESPSVIYNLGGSGGTGAVAGQDSIVKMHVEWSGGSENIELEPEL
ncbi:hypothetical protein PAECIP111892_05586 [Paenibacillus auburnensis]|uniref:Uncharacterized protein n=1 Tax=Paenibacillus auburnensis TaxID=2905649 RepID=A0ABN8H307_9BACL|nr:hypothetical protein [Paenibacillus auburnensis]CAH1225247.1 hypothetical protein PAECIP111892_05586 [Paenibacillus auburnensis]